MNVKRNFILFSPLLIILSAPLWWSGAGDLLKPRTDPAHQLPSGNDQMKSFVLEKVFLTQTRDGHDEFILKADWANSGVHADLLELEKVEAQLLDPDGLPTFIRGGEAFYNSAQQILTVLDDVQVATPDGMEIRTEALRYLSKYRKVKTAEDIVINGKEGRVSGSNLFYDLIDGNFRVGGGVEVDLY